MWALYAFLRSPDSFERTLDSAISGGGDTDSTSAFACALSGAYLGVEGIPAALVLLIDDQGADDSHLRFVGSQLFEVRGKFGQPKRKKKTGDAEGPLLTARRQARIYRKFLFYCSTLNQQKKADSIG